MKPSCRYFPLMALSSNLWRRKETRMPYSAWFLYRLPRPSAHLTARQTEAPQQTGGPRCGFPGRWHSLSGLLPDPVSPPPSDTCVYTYLCLSLMSTGLHTEPYRVSCHCRRMPAWDVSSPRAASRVVREPRPAVGHTDSRGPAHPATQRDSDHMSGHGSCLPVSH